MVIQAKNSPTEYRGHFLSMNQHGPGRWSLDCLRCKLAFAVSEREMGEAIEKGEPAEAWLHFLDHPCPKCPTCRGANRETVNLVCQTCGTDYGTPPTQPTDLAPEQMTDAESLGILVAGCLHAVEVDRDKARATAVTLKGQVAEATRHLKALVGLLDRVGTTFATDTVQVNQAREFVEGLDLPESPKLGEPS